MIISASRRTDIPAFYSRWFMNRVREGFVLTRNPFNPHQIRRVSLAPEDVDAIVFWTRNAGKLIDCMPELNRIGYNYYVHYTITGYPRILETHVPNPLQAIETFCRLSELIGPDRVIWRYDPILLSNAVPLDEHKRLFSKIAGLLAGRTRRVMISFADFYKKTERNLKLIDGLATADLRTQSDKLFELVTHMAEQARVHGMSISSCAEIMDLDTLGISHGKCIDETLLRQEFQLNLSAAKDKGQRPGCGCIKSVDIGSYNTCLHGCAYCYATFNEAMVEKNREQHDADSPLLIGSIEEAGSFAATRKKQPDLLQEAGNCNQPI